MALFCPVYGVFYGSSLKLFRLFSLGCSSQQGNISCSAAIQHTAQHPFSTPFSSRSAAIQYTAQQSFSSRIAVAQYAPLLLRARH